MLNKPRKHSNHALHYIDVRPESLQNKQDVESSTDWKELLTWTILWIGIISLLISLGAIYTQIPFV